MKAVLQRVKYAEVKVDGKSVGKIQKGLLIFLGIGKNDDEKIADKVIKKTCSKELEKDIQSGIFGADMKVELLNDGPVTIILDSEEI